VEFFSIENIHAVRDTFAHFRGLISVADSKDDALVGQKVDWSKINLQVLNGASRVYQLIESKVALPPFFFLFLLLFEFTAQTFEHYFPRFLFLFIALMAGIGRHKSRLSVES